MILRTVHLLRYAKLLRQPLLPFAFHPCRQVFGLANWKHLAPVSPAVNPNGKNSVGDIACFFLLLNASKKCDSVLRERDNAL